MVTLLFFKNTISKFSLCCIKVTSFRQIIIYYPNLMLNIFVRFELRKYVIAFLKDKQNIKFRGIC